MSTGAQALPKKSKWSDWILTSVAIFFLLSILTCLGTRSAYKGGYAPKAAILTEISQLDHALSDYKSRANSFPPCMGDADEELRQKRFYSHVTRAFPSYYVGDVKADSKRDYLDMREQILINFQGKPGTWYDLNTMDQAEALVFWLSGFPTPRLGGSPKGQLLGTSKVLGFCSSPSFPFFDAPGKPMAVFTSADANALTNVDRTVPSFSFDEARLVDQDGDGWLEYIPMAVSSKDLVAPLVYFDADLYTEQNTSGSKPSYRPYPSAIKGSPTLGPANNKAAASWGFATPFAAVLPHDDKSTLIWINPRKFQIICAGMDNRYGVLGPAPQGLSANLPKIFPAGIRYDTGGADYDNLTNFSDGRQLGDAQ